MTSDLTLEKLYTKALKYVAHSPRTTDEVKKRLLRYSKYFDVADKEALELIDAIVERFSEEKLLDDARYVKEFIFVINNSSKPRGIQYIRKFLMKKGIDRRLIDNALLDVSSDNQYDMASDLVKKKLSTLKYKDDFDARKKLWSLLIRRGFTGDIATRAIDNELGVK